MFTNAFRFSLALSLVACSAASEDVGTAAGADSTSDHAKHVETIAAKQYADQLDGMFGPYARGESAVYRGTFAAHENKWSPDSTDFDLPNLPATATLGMVDGSLTLHVQSAAKRHVDFVQSATGTAVSMILWDGQVGGMLSQCKDCIPDLSARPATVTLDHVQVDGHFFDIPETPFAITTTADLAKVPVSGITYSDLETTNAAYGFTPADTGNMLVHHVQDIVDENLPTKPGMYACWLRTNYALNQWVNPTDITKYGVSDFRVESISTCCLSPGVCAGGGACTPPKQTKSFTTGVGASVEVTTTTQIVSANGDVERTLTVAYDDHGAYFGGTESLQAVAVVHRQGMDGDMPITLKWSLANGKGSVTLPDAALITEIEFAFSNHAATRWDSNNSHNYKVTF